MTSKKNKVKVIAGPKDAKTESKILQSSPDTFRKLESRSADTSRNQTIDNSKVLMSLQKSIPATPISNETVSF